MNYKAHCDECEKKLGKGWEVVHRWLDYYANHNGAAFNPHHRIFRHHRKGVEEVRKMWGDQAAKAAELHIIADEGSVPEDERYYRQQEHNSYTWI